MPFVQQIKKVAKCDILLGMHGAGMTHMLWMPDWGAVVTLHETDDPLYGNIAAERVCGASSSFFALPVYALTL